MKLKAKLLVFLSLIFMVFSLPAQESDDYYGKNIKKITFENLVNIKDRDLDGITARFTGKPLTDELMSELFDRLFDLNYFDEILPKIKDNGRNVNLILSVKERPVIGKIIFLGNKAKTSNSLKSVINIKEKDIFSEDKILLDERAIRNAYIDEGFTDVEVSSYTEEGAKGINVFFQITEGRRTVVTKIQFNGNLVVSSKTLKGKIALKEKTLLFNDGYFQEALIEADKRTIQTYYQNRGYVDARVLNVRKTSVVNEKKDIDELTVTFEIQEGSQYKFGGITFEGNMVFSTETLQHYVRMKEGDIYNETKFQESRMNVQNLYYENGYTSNQFVPQVFKDSENKVISYSIKIVENPRSHVEKILVKGNTRTKDEIIFREIPLKEGDIFSSSKIQNGLRNLYNLQYFSSIIPEVTSGSENGLVDIVFSVEEQSTTTLDFGFQFSGVSDPDDFPVALYAKVSDSNLFGEGRNVSLGTTLSTDEQSITLGYGQNWLWDLPVSFNFSFGYSHSTNYAPRIQILPSGDLDDDTKYLEYTQHEFNMSASVGRRWTPDIAIFTLSGGISGSIIDNVYDNSLWIPYDDSVSRYANNWEPKNYIWTQLSVDGRNINWDPSNGWFASERLSWYGLLPVGVIPFSDDWGEREFYLRSDTKLEKYFTLIDYPVSETYDFRSVLMLYSGFSVQIPFFDTSIKQSNQLYVDGMFNGRGWTIYNMDAGRGCVLWSNIAELRFPVVPGILSIDLWADAIAIKDSFSELCDGLSSDDWYFSYGPSIRFTIQQFPLRLLFCNTFRIKEGEVVFCNQNGDPNSMKWYNNWHFVLSFHLTNR
ncbi:MAG: outer membrane protein assembly factor BamA [Treponema sp.]|nr:outer membrane protein assembly factor BamA [Treponema sp.]